MADLTTLDATKPPDTEAVSNGANRMREERSAIITSFDVEHHLDGAHTFKQGGVADRPALASGHDGRLFLNTTDYEMVEQQIGGIWAALHSARITRAFTAGSVVLAPGDNTIQTLAISTPFGARLVVLVQCTFTNTFLPGPFPIGESVDLTSTVKLDGTVIEPTAGQRFFWTTTTVGVNYGIVPFMHIALAVDGFGLTEGAHTLEWHINANTTGTSAANRMLGALAL